MDQKTRMAQPKNRPMREYPRGYLPEDPTARGEGPTPTQRHMRDVDQSQINLREFYPERYPNIRKTLPGMPLDEELGIPGPPMKPIPMPMMQQSPGEFGRPIPMPEMSSPTLQKPSIEELLRKLLPTRPMDSELDGF